jgi:hypothetical protein
MVKKTDDIQLGKVTLEIIKSEQKRAKKITGDPGLKKWVEGFREKFIVNDFLAPIYARDGLYSRVKLRVSKFGNYILPWEAQGKAFHKASQGWIRNEESWFWLYLTDGQEIISSRISIPDVLTIGGIPAYPIWQEIVTVVKNLQLFGEDGGGLILFPHWIDEGYLASTGQAAGWDEGEDGYLESYRIPKASNWITLFHAYKGFELSPQNIEIRPAWFHLANYAFFNAPIQRIPVFFCEFTEKGKVERIRFLDRSLSDKSREYIGKALLDMPFKVKQPANIGALKRERQEMVWWLWHNIGHKDEKRTLSYGDISGITGIPRSSIQTAVERFTRKLKKNMDPYLLGRLLRTADGLGLGYNIVYKTLVQRGLAPEREREIDGFDDLDKLV